MVTTDNSWIDEKGIDFSHFVRRMHERGFVTETEEMDER